MIEIHVWELVSFLVCAFSLGAIATQLYILWKLRDK
jgi:hypothetical protein